MEQLMHVNPQISDHCITIEDYIFESDWNIKSKTHLSTFNFQLTNTSSRPRPCCICLSLGHPETKQKHAGDSCDGQDVGRQPWRWCTHLNPWGRLEWQTLLWPADHHRPQKLSAGVLIVRLPEMTRQYQPKIIFLAWRLKDYYLTAVVTSKRPTQATQVTSCQSWRRWWLGGLIYNSLHLLFFPCCVRVKLV